MISCSNCSEAATLEYFGIFYCPRHLPRFLRNGHEHQLRPVVQPTLTVSTPVVEDVSETPQADEPVRPSVKAPSTSAPKKRVAPKKPSPATVKAVAEASKAD